MPPHTGPTYSPPRRGGVAAPREAKAQTGWSDRSHFSPNRRTVRCLRSRRKQTSEAARSSLHENWCKDDLAASDVCFRRDLRHRTVRRFGEKWLRSDHPVCAFASRGAATPPLRGGEYVGPVCGGMLHQPDHSKTRESVWLASPVWDGLPNRLSFPDR